MAAWKGTQECDRWVVPISFISAHICFGGKRKEEKGEGYNGLTTLQIHLIIRMISAGLTGKQRSNRHVFYW